MTDDICATIPACLGHANSTVDSCRAPLVMAYGAVWPLFLAGTCTLECVGSGVWTILNGIAWTSDVLQSPAYAQARWVLGRLEYISRSVGLRWADGIASPLRGEFRVRERTLGDE